MRTRKDGQRIEVSLIVFPIRNARGDIIGISSTARDITDRVEAEQSVRESEERLRALVANISDVVSLMGADGTPLYLCFASFAGGLHPGKTQAGWTACDVSWGGTENWVTQYYVVVPDFQVKSSNPYGAGVDTDGTPLGICKAGYFGSVQVGKLSASGTCSFGFGARNISVTTSQALALPPLIH